MAYDFIDSVRNTVDNLEDSTADADAERRNWTSVLVEDNKAKTPKPITGKAKMPVERDAEEYNMSHPFRGKAVIFNQEVFKVDGLATRLGTNKDRDNLAKTLRKLEFKVESYNDLSRQTLMQKLTDLANDDHTEHDCILIVVLSHGETDKIYASDDSYAPDDLWDPFTAERCPTLAGKPKIFLIQACKGSQLDGGTVLKPHKGYHQTDSATFTDSYKIPNRADFLVVFSTYPGYFSWRNSQQGSWFIQSVCKVLDQHGHHKELLSMITAISRNVALEFESQAQLRLSEMDQKKQIPFVTHTLIREVYFRPKIARVAVPLPPIENKDRKLLQASISRNIVDENPRRHEVSGCEACTGCCSAV